MQDLACGRSGAMAVDTELAGSASGAVVFSPGCSRREVPIPTVHLAAMRQHYSPAGWRCGLKGLMLLSRVKVSDLSLLARSSAGLGGNPELFARTETTGPRSHVQRKIVPRPPAQRFCRS